MQSILGEQLRQYRKARNWSQVQLARACGVTHSAISRIEIGSRSPSREVVDALAMALMLNDVERARFYQAAGFHDSTIASVFSEYKELLDIYHLITDPQTSDEIKDIVRASLRTMLALKNVSIAPYPLINLPDRRALRRGNSLVVQRPTVVNGGGLTYRTS